MQLTPPHLSLEGKVLFNDALDTFYLRLYRVGHMVKDHSDSERGNPLPPHGLLFIINNHPTYHSLCYTSCRALAGTRNSSMGPLHEVSIQRPIAPWANALTREVHFYIMHYSHREKTAPNTTFDIPVVEHWLRHEIPIRAQLHECLALPIRPLKISSQLELVLRYEPST